MLTSHEQNIQASLKEKFPGWTFLDLPAYLPPTTLPPSFDYATWRETHTRQFDPNVKIDRKHKTRVARGARLLDKIKPNWFKRISIDKLDINSVHDCVLGQLYEITPKEMSKGKWFTNFDKGLSKVFGLPTDDDSRGTFDDEPYYKKAETHGFFMNIYEDDPTVEDQLRQCWINEIKKRKSR